MTFSWIVEITQRSGLCNIIQPITQKDEKFNSLHEKIDRLTSEKLGFCP